MKLSELVKFHADHVHNMSYADFVEWVHVQCVNYAYNRDNNNKSRPNQVVKRRTVKRVPKDMSGADYVSVGLGATVGAISNYLSGKKKKKR